MPSAPPGHCRPGPARLGGSGPRCGRGADGPGLAAGGRATAPGSRGWRHLPQSPAGRADMLPLVPSAAPVNEPGQKPNASAWRQHEPRRRFHVADEPVAAVTQRVAGICRLPGAAGVRHDQLPGPAQATQVTEVLASPAGAAGQSHQRRPIAECAVADLGAVVGSETGHGAIMPGPACCGTGWVFRKPRSPQLWGSPRARCSQPPRGATAASVSATAPAGSTAGSTTGGWFRRPPLTGGWRPRRGERPPLLRERARSAMVTRGGALRCSARLLRPRSPAILAAGSPWADRWPDGTLNSALPGTGAPFGEAQ